MKLHKISYILFGVLIYLVSQASFAVAVWGTDVTGSDLMSSRSTAPLGGLTANPGSEWATDGTSISWDISFDGAYWNYKYTIDTSESGKAVSNFILEFTQDKLCCKILNPNGGIEGPQLWTKSGNQDFPNGSTIFGVKFDFGGNDDSSMYTFKTDRAPVWGTFFAKGGNNTDNFVYNNALDDPNYRTNMQFTENDFIARPNGITVIPVPAAVWLFGSALLGLIGFRRKVMSAS